MRGERVLYNSVCTIQTPSRRAALPKDHRFVGPLVRNEPLPDEFSTWSHRADDQPQVYVALGTFLSHRSDVLVRVADALRHLGVRAALATGATPLDAFGHVPADWVVARQLPQVAMLASSDLVVHHGGNNTVQEALAAGCRQVVPAVLNRSVLQRRGPRTKWNSERVITERRDRSRVGAHDRHQSEDTATSRDLSAGLSSPCRRDVRMNTGG